MEKPSIYAYRQSRAYLRAAFEYLRARDRKYSLAYFSQRLKRSPAYLKLVLSGKRELTLDTAAALGKALRLDASERAYLINLALQESAASGELRTFAANQLVNLRRDALAYAPDRKLTSVFANSLTWELFSLIGVEGFEADPRWILPRLRRRDKSAAAVQMALRQLEAMGAVEREGDRLKAADVVLKHGADVNRIYLSAARRQIEHLSGTPDDAAYFDAFCLILTEQEYEQIRVILEEAKQKMGRVASERSKKTRIAYYNAGLFWASS
jgi:uncharacterized protein (TIGR02147 family)